MREGGCLVGVVVFVSRWSGLEKGRVLSSRPFTNHKFSPEGLATRRSIEINGNYFTRERDE